MDFLDSPLPMKFSTRVFLLKDYFTFILFFHKGEVRAVMVAFDDPETGIEAMAKHKYDEEIRKYSNEKGVPIFRQGAILLTLMFCSALNFLSCFVIKGQKIFFFTFKHLDPSLSKRNLKN